MEPTYTRMVKFMDSYFADYNQYAGDPKTLPNMLKYYLPEIELFSYTLNAQRPFNLERILQSMTHPGLHEEFTPRYYVIDVNKRAVVVQMQNQFSEEASQKTYPVKQLSVHYYLVDNPSTDFKIKKILFFVEPRPPNEIKMADLIKKYQAEIFTQNKAD